SEPCSDTVSHFHSGDQTATLSTDTALAAATKGRWRSQKSWLPGHTHHAGAKCCTTCATHGRSCGGHKAPFCMHPGGAMAKQGFEAARNAAHATNPTLNVHTDKNKAPTGGGKVYTQLTDPGGKVYLVEDGDLGKLQTLSASTTSTPVGFAGLVTDSVLSSSAADDSEWEGWMAIIEEEELQA
ncbi:hypothetical protein C0993_001807, partial [Termitomyces sp. T159_Od127]